MRCIIILNENNFKCLKPMNRGNTNTFKSQMDYIFCIAFLKISQELHYFLIYFN